MTFFRKSLNALLITKVRNINASRNVLGIYEFFELMSSLSSKRWLNCALQFRMRKWREKNAIDF